MFLNKRGLCALFAVFIFGFAFSPVLAASGEEEFEPLAMTTQRLQ